MNTLLRSPGLGLTLSLALFFTSDLRVTAEETAAPPDLRDLATGDAVPSAQTLLTKDFGAMVQEAMPVAGTMRARDLDSVVQALVQPGRTPLRAGDLILAVDGWRVHDGREYEIARSKQATAPKMTLLVNRRGSLETLRLQDLPPGRKLGVEFDEAVEQGSFADAVAACGVTLDDASRGALKSVSRQAASALEAWRRQAGATPDTAWLQDFIKLFLAVQQRRYAEAAAPAHQLPIPLFQRLAKFYLAIAEKNNAQEVMPANWAEYGESAEFFVLNLPLPAFVPPPLGEVKFSEPNFQRLLEKRRADFSSTSAELSNAARKYVNAGSDGLEQFLNQTNAALLDPAQHGGWPFRSALVARHETRLVMLPELRKRLANAADADWPLIAYATLGPLCLEPLRPEAAALLQQLSTRSPFLAWAGGELCYTASRASKFPGRGMPRLQQVIKQNDYFLPKDVPQIYRWALLKIPPILEENKQGGATVDPRQFFSGSPLPVLQALQTAAKAEVTP